MVAVGLLHAESENARIVEAKRVRDTSIRVSIDSCAMLAHGE